MSGSCQPRPKNARTARCHDRSPHHRSFLDTTSFPIKPHSHDRSLFFISISSSLAIIYYIYIEHYSTMMMCNSLRLVVKRSVVTTTSRMVAPLSTTTGSEADLVLTSMDAATGIATVTLNRPPVNSLSLEM